MGKPTTTAPGVDGGHEMIFDVISPGRRLEAS